MAELTGFLAMSHGPQLMVKPDQWNLPTGVGCGMGFGYWNGSK
jgi:hypothetical protein